MEESYTCWTTEENGKALHIWGEGMLADSPEDAARRYIHDMVQLEKPLKHGDGLLVGVPTDIQGKRTFRSLHVFKVEINPAGHSVDIRKIT